MTQIPSSAPPSFSSSSCLSRSARSPAKPMTPAISPATGRDYSSDIPDECLELIFQSLGSGDRKRCSLVCRRWLAVDGQSRHRLSLDARVALAAAAPSIFTRFDSVTKLGSARSPRRRRSLDLPVPRIRWLAVDGRSRHRLSLDARAALAAAAPSSPPMTPSISPPASGQRRLWAELRPEELEPEGRHCGR